MARDTFECYYHESTFSDPPYGTQKTTHSSEAHDSRNSSASSSRYSSELTGRATTSRKSSGCSLSPTEQKRSSGSSFRYSPSPTGRAQSSRASFRYSPSPPRQKDPKVRSYKPRRSCSVRNKSADECEPARKKSKKKGGTGPEPEKAETPKIVEELYKLHTECEMKKTFTTEVHRQAMNGKIRKCFDLPPSALRICKICKKGNHYNFSLLLEHYTQKHTARINAISFYGYKDKYLLGKRTIVPETFCSLCRKNYESDQHFYHHIIQYHIKDCVSELTDLHIANSADVEIEILFRERVIAFGYSFPLLKSTENGEAGSSTSHTSQRFHTNLPIQTQLPDSEASLLAAKKGITEEIDDDFIIDVTTVSDDSCDGFEVRSTPVQDGLIFPKTKVKDACISDETCVMPSYFTKALASLDASELQRALEIGQDHSTIDGIVRERETSSIEQVPSAVRDLNPANIGSHGIGIDKNAVNHVSCSDHTASSSFSFTNNVQTLENHVPPKLSKKMDAFSIEKLLEPRIEKP